MSSRSQKAFSLTEILIALGILILFITLPILAYTNYAKKARDEKRKTDLLKMGQSLEQYRAEKGVYPPDLEDLKTEGYLPEIPVDPRDGELVAGEEGIEYGYSYESDGASYTLMARLEDDVRSTVAGGGTGGLGTISNVNISGTATGVADGSSYSGTVTVTGTITNGSFSGTFSGSLSGGSISGTITNATVTGGSNGAVTGSCTYAQGNVAGTAFSGLVASCNLTGALGGPGDSGPGVFIVKPSNPRGEDIPIAQLSEEAGTSPSVTIPTKTPYITATGVLRAGSATITPAPCTTNITCSGSCQQLNNRCASVGNTYQSTMSSCLYYTRPGFPVCQPMPAPDQACTISSDTCTTGTGEHPNCSGTNCIPDCNTSISCSGSCQQLVNRCGSYSSTRSGCTYTAYSGGGACQTAAAPDQVCTVTGDTCTVGTGEHPNCSGSTCIPNCNATPSCSGSCQNIAGRCAPNIYTSTRSGCTYTTYSGGGACTSVGAPDQSCSITSQSCTSPPYCETSTSNCRTCLTNAHCPSASAPRCASYACTGCASDADCSNFSGTYCNAGTCTQPTYSTYFAGTSELPYYKGINPSQTDNSTYVQRVYSTSGNYYMGTYKFDYRGNLVWNAGAGSVAAPTQWLYPRGVMGTADGGVLAVGSVIFDPANARHSALVQKFSSTGTLEMQSVIGRPGVFDGDLEFYRFEELPVAQGGGYIMAGIYATSSSPYQIACYVMRMNTSGNIVWQKIIGNATMACTVQALGYNAAGNNIVMNASSGSIPGGGIGGTGSTDTVVYKFDLSGNLLSAWAYGTNSTDFTWQQTAGVSRNDGNVIMTLGLNTYATNILIRFNPNTTLASSIVWKRQDNNAVESINIYDDGSYGMGLLVSGTGSPHNLAAFDAAGNKLWERYTNPFLGGSRVNCNYGFIWKQLNGQYVATSKCSGAQYIWKLKTDGSTSACTDLTSSAAINNYLTASAATVSMLDVTANIPIANASGSKESPSVQWNYENTRTNNCTY